MKRIPLRSMQATSALLDSNGLTGLFRPTAAIFLRRDAQLSRF
jgi:hypothetical protein